MDSRIYSTGLNTELRFDFRLSFIILPINVDQFILSVSREHFKEHGEKPPA